MTTTIAPLEGYLDRFTELEQEVAESSPRWLKKLRADAFVRFSETGFPTTHEEDWRFTNLAPLTRTSFQMASRLKTGLTAADLAQWKIPGTAAQLVFVNGHYSQELSNADTLLDRGRVSGLADILQNSPELVEDHLGRYLDQERDPFGALNTAFLEDGGYIHIPKGTILAGPIHLLFVSTAEDGPTMSFPRNLVIVEEGAQATIVEDYVSLGAEVPVFSNAATELIAGENAIVSHILVERENRAAFNVSTLRVQLGRSANVSSHSLLLGGRLVRNNVHPVLAGEGAECLINGLFIGNETQHLDNYMYVEHASPHCNSRQFYNGILSDRARGVFHGRIVVHKDAQKTDAKQTNRNLLLSDSAQIDTKPQLEIYADDVKCTHGATIGQMEENALFYLRSRGIDEVTARELLLMAFAGECLERIEQDDLRRHLQQAVQTSLEEIASSAPKQVTVTGTEQNRDWEEQG